MSDIYARFGCTRLKEGCCPFALYPSKDSDDTTNKNRQKSIDELSTNTIYITRDGGKENPLQRAIAMAAHGRPDGCAVLNEFNHLKAPNEKLGCEYLESFLHTRYVSALLLMIEDKLR